MTRNKRSETPAPCQECGKEFYPWIKYGGEKSKYCSQVCGRKRYQRTNNALFDQSRTNDPDERMGQLIRS
jgi:hypothetical protein